MADKSTVGGGGIGFGGLLAIVFITLKLCKVITWSWWAVTCPLWIIPVLIVVGVLVYLTALAFVSVWRKN
jgi:hypothetical protein